jgi:hypothetical protein
MLQYIAASDGKFGPNKKRSAAKITSLYSSRVIIGKVYSPPHSVQSLNYSVGTVSDELRALRLDTVCRTLRGRDISSLMDSFIQ